MSQPDAPTAEAYYDRPLPIAEGVFWVGFNDVRRQLHCNPYLIVEDDRAVLIDGGSRSDFATVMTKILQTGVDPRRIEALVYQHYDPDLCGSMANLIDICDNPDLRIYTERHNEAFLACYLPESERRRIHLLDELDGGYRLGERLLTFVPTPYAHAAGSFVTYDEATRTVFSSDLFGSFSPQWDLFLELDDACITCTDYDACPQHKPHCPVPGIHDFHRHVMPSTKALRRAMDVIGALDIEIIAPQHGSVIRGERDVRFLIESLASLPAVGIDGLPST